MKESFKTDAYSGGYGGGGLEQRLSQGNTYETKFKLP
jgi:hypothetical protein